MSDDDSRKFSRENANLERNGLDGTAPVGNRFNVEVERGAEIAQASDRAKEMIKDHAIVRDSRMETQLAREEKYRTYGLQKEKAKLLEQQFTSPQPIPNDPKAREVMHKEIEAATVRNYDKRNQYFRDQIDRQHKHSVDEILKLDREDRLPERELNHDHSQEHDQEHEWDGR